MLFVLLVVGYPPGVGVVRAIWKS